jgi:hypothetical protein
MKKVIVACSSFAMAPGNNKDIMTLSSEVDVIVNTLYLEEGCAKNFF